MSGSLAIAVASLLAIGWYALSCWWFPFGKCWCCDGKGTHFRKDGQVFRTCKWWCKGTGRKLRRGRRVYGFLRKKIGRSA